MESKEGTHSGVTDTACLYESHSHKVNELVAPMGAGLPFVATKRDVTTDLKEPNDASTPSAEATQAVSKCAIVAFQNYLDETRPWEAKSSPAASNNEDSVSFQKFCTLYSKKREEELGNISLSKYIVQNELEAPALRSLIAAGDTLLEQRLAEGTLYSPALLLEALTKSMTGCIGFWSQAYRPYILSSHSRQGYIRRLEFWSHKAAQIPDGEDAPDNSKLLLNHTRAIFANDSLEAIQSAGEAYAQHLINRLTFGSRKVRSSWNKKSSVPQLNLHLV
jgi:hypothetical protein